MLKKKIEANYRKALGSRVCCKKCVHYKFIDIHGIGKIDVLWQAWRCETIGLENSRRYSVRADHVCSEFLKAAEAKQCG